MAFNGDMLLDGKKKPSQMVGSFGVVDRMVHGMSTVHSELVEAHPLEKSLKQNKVDRARFDLNMLRKTQGIHAPLKLMMERKAAFHIQRLPCLSSSHIMLDTLIGNDESIGFGDVFNDPYNSEELIQPHMAIEKKMALL